MQQQTEFAITPLRACNLLLRVFNTSKIRQDGGICSFVGA